MKELNDYEVADLIDTLETRRRKVKKKTSTEKRKNKNEERRCENCYYDWLF